MSTREQVAELWYEKFNRFAGDLYPGRYTPAFCRELVDQAWEIASLRTQKNSVIVAHNYLYPEFHELADKVGDSLGLARHVQEIGATRVDFQSVAFMGQTAKMITGDSTRVFIPDYPEVLGCSLVFGTDYNWIEEWKRRTGGILVTYINSDPYTKSISEYIGTSSNFDKVIVHAAKEYPNRKILVLPDRFLGYVMKAKAEAQGVDPDLIEVYELFKGHNRASCYVHEKIQPTDIVDQLMAQCQSDPRVELLVHPECGCASSCMLKMQKSQLSEKEARVFFCSTEGMVRHARTSPAELFYVATEIGMIYRLRKELPEKNFVPVSLNAECRYMKENTLAKLLRSLKEDRLELTLCDDCCDPKKPYQDDRVVHIQKTIANKSRQAIDRMLAIN